MKLDAQEQLAAAQVALDRGDAKIAGALASSILEHATAAGDTLLQAKAIAFLAHGARLLSKTREAHELAVRAAQLFRVVGDHAGEAFALTTQAHVASALGRNEEAVEAGLLSVELAKEATDSRLLAIAHIHLGIALLFGRSFDEARRVLEAAVSVASACRPPFSAFQAHVTALCCECVRVLVLRHETARNPDLNAVQSLMAVCERDAASGQASAVNEGVNVTLQGLWRLSSAAGQCWLGNTERAEAELNLALEWAAAFGATTWMDAYAHLVRSELASSQGRWAEAEFHARRGIEVGEQVEHEQVALLGRLVAVNACLGQGRTEDAVAYLREMTARERRIRIEGLESRARVIRWQLDIRQSEKARLDLALAAQHLERLSMEDPLTTLANRRCFESRGAELLRASQAEGNPLSVALLDVDRFKKVNDTFSHSVGDRVLEQIAALLRQHARQDDIAARLAGDEFVVAFRRADHKTATEVCLRIQRAVAAFDWESIAARLAVSVSFGVAQSEPGDTLASLVHRSDEAMYRAK